MITDDSDQDFTVTVKRRGRPRGFFSSFSNFFSRLFGGKKETTVKESTYIPNDATLADISTRNQQSVLRPKSTTAKRPNFLARLVFGGKKRTPVTTVPMGAIGRPKRSQVADSMMDPKVTEIGDIDDWNAKLLDGNVIGRSTHASVLHPSGVIPDTLLLESRGSSTKSSVDFKNNSNKRLPQLHKGKIHDRRPGASLTTVNTQSGRSTPAKYATPDVDKGLQAYSLISGGQSVKINSERTDQESYLKSMKEEAINKEKRSVNNSEDKKNSSSLKSFNDKRYAVSTGEESEDARVGSSLLFPSGRAIVRRKSNLGKGRKRSVSNGVTNEPPLVSSRDRKVSGYSFMTDNSNAAVEAVNEPLLLIDRRRKASHDKMGRSLPRQGTSSMFSLPQAKKEVSRRTRKASQESLNVLQSKNHLKRVSDVSHSKLTIHNKSTTTILASKSYVSRKTATKKSIFKGLQQIQGSGTAMDRINNSGYESPDSEDIDL